MLTLINDYQELLTNCCFTALLSIGNVLMICFDKVMETFRRQRNNWKSIDLHRAVFAHDIVKSIEISARNPQFINKIHAADGFSPFMRACLNGNTMLVKHMLKCGACIFLKSTKGETPFYLSTSHHVRNPEQNDASCIRALFYAGADINEPNENGHTPLDFAAMFGHANLCIWLLKKGANAENSIKPYLLARYQGHPETAKILRTQLEIRN